MSEDFDAVVDRIRQRVEPDDDEREALESAAAELCERTEAALESVESTCEVMLVGSTARETWLAGDPDIDIFICFPPDISRDELESLGLQIGREVLPEGHEEYAEHPYIVGQYEGFDVDIVPCYDVDDPTDIQSAVDRTPFHTRYIQDRITPSLASEIRVCKRFFTGIGVYGSDLKTRGFSGFLTELLVSHYGSFETLVREAADWDLPLRLDPEDHGRTTFDDPLVVIDPTDPDRNVAAVLSRDNVARVQHFAREFIDSPSEEIFEPLDVTPLDAATVQERFDHRGTSPVAIQFDTPDLVDDQLWPQLERSRRGITAELIRLGFDVLRTDAFATDETAALLFELAVAERPAIERHEGPPLQVRDHAESFYETYVDSAASGPFIDGDRYVVERQREFRTAREFLASEALFDVALGTHVQSTLETEYTVLVGDTVGSLADTFGLQLAHYLDPTPRNI